MSISKPSWNLGEYSAASLVKLASDLVPSGTHLHYREIPTPGQYIKRFSSQ